MVRSVVVQNKLRRLYSRSARANLDRLLSAAMEHHWPTAGTLDALALSQRAILDTVRIHEKRSARARRPQCHRHSQRQRRRAAAIPGRKTTAKPAATHLRFPHRAEQTRGPRHPRHEGTRGTEYPRAVENCRRGRNETGAGAISENCR